jgi:hypothetical protein
MAKSYLNQRITKINNIITSQPVLKRESRLHLGEIVKMLLLTSVILAMSIIINRTYEDAKQLTPFLIILTVVAVSFVLRNFISEMLDWLICRNIRKEAKNAWQKHQQVTSSTNILQHKKLISIFKRKLGDAPNELFRKQYACFLNNLTGNLEKLKIEDNLQSLRIRYRTLQADNVTKIEIRLKNNPILVARKQLKESLAQLKDHRKYLQVQWDAAYEKFSWWQKMTTEEPDFKKVDRKISELTRLSDKFEFKHGKDVETIKKRYAETLSFSKKRIEDAYLTACEIIQDNKDNAPSSNDLLQKAGWCAALGFSVSAWNDFSQAGNVYDSLRKVNQNFQGMSDSDIWWETLWMSDSSLAGLTSLTKGAYFEELVANDTGGELFDNFNHPDTDIIIDGIEVQIKATNSISYIESVDSEIPVIATSEVAAQTGVIDGGHTNEQITDAVDLAFGGTVLDIADVAADTILCGFGGLGFFATIRGMSHAVTQYNDGAHPGDAMVEGTCVAITGTAKGLVDTAELAFKIVTCKPCRFVGRHIYSGAEKLGRKISQ